MELVQRSYTDTIVRKNRDWRVLQSCHTHLNNGRMEIMVLKGVMTIELTDETTGGCGKPVTEENMITESVNNILGLNPMGYLLRGNRGV